MTEAQHTKKDPFLCALKFIYSEKATKFCEIFTLLLTGTTYDKCDEKNSQKFVVFSEYMNFKVIWEFEFQLEVLETVYGGSTKV